MKPFEFFDDVNVGFITEEELYEMANIVQKYSGISHFMYISTSDVAKNRHGPRIKVPNIGNTFSATDNFVVTISRTPQIIGKAKISTKDLDDIKDWVILNYEILMNFWDKVYQNDPVEFYMNLQKV